MHMHPQPLCGIANVHIGKRCMVCGNQMRMPPTSQLALAKRPRAATPRLVSAAPGKPRDCAQPMDHSGADNFV